MGHFGRNHNSASFLRRIFVPLILFALIAMSTPAYAAVPTYVVEFELNTKFERSLERFMFDLFNTLQRRDEDFTAAFELQKIEKAREDTAKLFQEVASELQGFGLAYEVADERISNDSTGDEAPLFISPLKGSRIIRDPISYLVEEPLNYGRMAFACRMNYIIWDQQGIQAIYGDSQAMPGATEVLKVMLADVQKATFAPTTNESVTQLANAKWLELTGLHVGHWTRFDDGPAGSLASDDFVLNEKLFGHGDQPAVQPLCDQIMELFRAETPASALADVLIGTKNVVFPTPEAGAATRARMVRKRLILPTLARFLGDDRSTTSFISYEEYDALFLKGGRNLLGGVVNNALSEASYITTSYSEIHKLNYAIGKGVRPENLYVTLTTTNSEFDTAAYLNTEYIISPAVVLLQKMQAATQATFDLAGQGFLYLDAETTPDEILGRYNLVSTASNDEERKICNNAGACQLLDAWLKPAASFRSVATIDGDQETPRIIGPNPQRLGVDFGGGTEETIAGSGLPAPWEDESTYVFFTPEDNWFGIFDRRRYTISRFRNSTGGLDENDGVTGIGNPDNIGFKFLSADFPLNDWYDRIFEMYESGIGKNATEREGRSSIYGLDDWECNIALWFIGKRPGEAGSRVFSSTPGSDKPAPVFSLSLIDHCGYDKQTENLVQFED